MSRTPLIVAAPTEAGQGELHLPSAVVRLLQPGVPLSGLDLFAGIGGLSAGFAELGFSMQGVDSERIAGQVYENAGFGISNTCDLASALVVSDAPLVIGGPPCRPWSPVNLQRRGEFHKDHGLLSKFMAHLHQILPVIFVMENVPALRSDPIYSEGVDSLRLRGYSIAAQVLHYDRFGAATKRRRLFTVGVRDSRAGGEHFFSLLSDQHAVARTVRDAIIRFRDFERGAVPDHDWSELRTIKNYTERYATGQYGWRRLVYDSQAPSFGSVAKTYILHPEAGVGDFPERVISVREVMAIMGFSDEVRFPSGTSRAKRYQMVANSVSPYVSRAIAATVKRMLTGA
jgi:site-specific DNA-cytosine methylase